MRLMDADEFLQELKADPVFAKNAKIKALTRVETLVKQAVQKRKAQENEHS